MAQATTAPKASTSPKSSPSKSGTAKTGTAKTKAARSTTAKTSAAKTTRAKTSTPKASTAKRATTTRSKATSAAKPAAKPRTRRPAKAATPVVVAEAVVNTLAPDMKKTELVDAVVEKTGAKKREVKVLVDTVLTILGETLSEGRGLNMEPLGKVKVNRTKTLQSRQVTMLKLRQGRATEKDPQDPLASAAE